MKRILILSALLPAGAFALPGKDFAPADLRDAAGAMSMPAGPALAAASAVGVPETVSLNLLLAENGAARIESPRLGVKISAKPGKNELVFSNGLSALLRGGAHPIALSGNGVRASLEKLAGGAYLLSGEIERGGSREPLRVVISPSQDGGFRVFEPGASLSFVRLRAGAWRAQGGVEFGRFSREKLSILACAFASALGLGR